MLNNIFQFVGGILNTIFSPLGGNEYGAISQRFRDYLNQIVTVETTAGTISGQLTAVGTDYIELLSAGVITLVHHESIISIDPQGGAM